ncbi:MAG: hypothetical protein ACI8YQ_001630 [Polaribacter sp.]|jgi:hypothetical protein
MTANGAQLIGMSQQYKDSANAARELSNKIGDQELTFTGHSKGGGQAALNSMVATKMNKKMREKRSAITFNAANVTGYTKFANKALFSKAKIDAYMLATDPISILQLFLTNGKKHILKPTSKRSIINGHSMDNMSDEMDKRASLQGGTPASQ